jgi:hypothetical protein
MVWRLFLCVCSFSRRGLDRLSGFRFLLDQRLPLRDCRFMAVRVVYELFASLCSSFLFVRAYELVTSYLVLFLFTICLRVVYTCFVVLWVVCELFTSLLFTSCSRVVYELFVSRLRVLFLSTL